MAEIVTCKMKCYSKEISCEGTDQESTVLRFQAVCNGSPENEKFFKYTPSGELNFYTVNKAAADVIEQGEEYYIDIHK